MSSRTDSGQSNPWSVYTGSDLRPSSQTNGFGGQEEAPWKSFGASMNAISIGFVATAILISMFLVMAIFEHLFRPSSSSSSFSSSLNEAAANSPESRVSEKFGNSQQPVAYALDFSVVMPGQYYPTYIAQPAPLPCQREGIYWPAHHQRNLAYSS